MRSLPREYADIIASGPPNLLRQRDASIFYEGASSYHMPTRCPSASFEALGLLPKDLCDL